MSAAPKEMDQEAGAAPEAGMRGRKAFDQAVGGVRTQQLLPVHCHPQDPLGGHPCACNAGASL